MSEKQAPITVYPVSDFLEWHESEQLEIAPWFQRRPIWTAKARSYLIDSILRGMPIPPLFIRLQVQLPKRRSFRQVVDGQQRIRAILDFIAGEFPVLRVHNSDYANKRFDDLPFDAQQTVLSYKLPVYVLEGATDSDVLRIFARLNTYTIPLNKQELRNAEYFGAFKQVVYDIGFEHLTFWRNNKILTDQQIARMDDAELVSELLVTVLAGFQTTKDRELRHYYEDWDDDLPDNQERIARRFSRTIDTIGLVFDAGLASGPYRRIPLFFSLFCLFYDGLFGLPSSKSPRLTIKTGAQAEAVRIALEQLARKTRMKRPPRDYQPFVEASRLGTADPGKRKLRHEFLWRAVRTAL